MENNDYNYVNVRMAGTNVSQQGSINCVPTNQFHIHSNKLVVLCCMHVHNMKICTQYDYAATVYSL